MDLKKVLSELRACEHKAEKAEEKLKILTKDYNGKNLLKLTLLAEKDTLMKDINYYIHYDKKLQSDVSKVEYQLRNGEIANKSLEQKTNEYNTGTLVQSILDPKFSNNPQETSNEEIYRMEKQLEELKERITKNTEVIDLFSFISDDEGR